MPFACSSAIRKNYGLSLPLSTLFERSEHSPARSVARRAVAASSKCPTTQETSRRACVVSSTEYSSLVAHSTVGHEPGILLRRRHGRQPAQPARART